MRLDRTRALLREAVLRARRRSWHRAGRRRRPAGPGGREGRMVDGDQLLALIAGSWHADGRLSGEDVVATVMSNSASSAIWRRAGLELRAHPRRRPLRRRADARDGCNLGGEQSGHIVLSDFATTGDGLLAALQVLAVLRAARAAGERGLRGRSSRLPQRLRNVRVAAPARPGRRRRSRRPARRAQRPRSPARPPPGPRRRAPSP